MFRGLWKLVWVELKVFMREPMGSVSTLLLPVILFLLLGGVMRNADRESFDAGSWIGSTLPVLIILIIAVNAVVSLTTIMSIYRESGILKRLKATPLQPQTILTAHVIVKLLITAVNVGTLLLVGKRFFGIGLQGSVVEFALAVVICTVSILSLGFVIASIVPTARFAQLIAGSILYPLFGISGLFAPVDAFPLPLKAVAYASPLTHTVTLTTATWQGESLAAHGFEILALTGSTVLCVALSSRIFRWE